MEYQTLNPRPPQIDLSMKLVILRDSPDRPPYTPSVHFNVPFSFSIEHYLSMFRSLNRKPYPHHTYSQGMHLSQGWAPTYERDSFPMSKGPKLTYETYKDKLPDSGGEGRARPRRAITKAQYLQDLAEAFF